MIIQDFNGKDGVEDYAIETWMEVANFLIHAVHKLPNNKEVDDSKKKLAKFLNKVIKKAKKEGQEFVDNDLRFSCMTFIILDHVLSSRSFEQSQVMFVELLKTAANQFGKADIVSLDKFVTEKTSNALESGYQEWTVLNELLCSANAINNSSNEAPTVTNILDSLVSKVVKEKTDLMSNFDFSNLKIEIIDDIIEIEKKEDN